MRTTILIAGLLVAILTCVNIVRRYTHGHEYADPVDVVVYGAIFAVLMIIAWVLR